MSDASINLRNLFSFPDRNAPAAPSNQWQQFQNRLGREIKTIKWPAAMPDLTSKIAELFDVELPELLIASWEKATQLQELLEESRKTPEQVIFLELAEHVITSDYHPYIEIRIAEVPLPKRIQFTVGLSVTLKGVVLRIKGGEIIGIETGSCEFEGKVKYEDLTIADKKLGPIRLSGLLTFGNQEAH